MNEKPAWYPEVPFENPDESAYAPDGVDLTMIRFFLDLSPAQRLAHLDGWVRSMDRLKNAFDSGRG